MEPLREFEELAHQFEERFKVRHFPAEPARLYDAAEYILSIKGKRIRPVMCMMANELFTPVTDDTIHAAIAVELFHNFTLIHDDIMDRAAIRRGQPTVHEKFGNATAILAGDVMLIAAYDYLKKVNIRYLTRTLNLFNDAARKVCEGQELDMEFESLKDVSMDQYIGMISLKTSVLLAVSLRLGALLGGAGLANQENLYEFGRNLGIAFQIQDDYLDVYGNPETFGKKRGGDIMANKMTFLLLRTREIAGSNQKKKLEELMSLTDESKIDEIIQLYNECGVGDWSREMKSKYLQQALHYLEEVAVVSKRKEPLIHLAGRLSDREK